MKLLSAILICFLLPSCFLFGTFRKRTLSFTEDGGSRYAVAVPKGFLRAEHHIDSAGNEQHFYVYPLGARLYFVKAKDTGLSYQPIHYPDHIPRTLNSTVFYKGIDSAGLYWRETRFGNYKAGYYSAAKGSDWKFDSALNSFARLQKVQ